MCPYRNCISQKTVTWLTNFEFNNDEMLTVDLKKKKKNIAGIQH